MKYIIQSRIIGDTKWNFRAEVELKKTEIDTMKNFHKNLSNVIKQDRKLKIQNKYRVIPQ
jgi:hypothetical protein